MLTGLLGLSWGSAAELANRQIPEELLKLRCKSLVLLNLLARVELGLLELTSLLFVLSLLFLLLCSLLGLGLLCWFLLFLLRSAFLAALGSLGGGCWLFGLLLGLSCLGLLGFVLAFTLRWALSAAGQPVVCADVRGLLLAVEAKSLLLELEQQDLKVLLWCSIADERDRELAVRPVL